MSRNIRSKADEHLYLALPLNSEFLLRHPSLLDTQINEIILWHRDELGIFYFSFSFRLPTKIYFLPIVKRKKQKNKIKQQTSFWQCGRQFEYHFGCALWCGALFCSSHHLAHLDSSQMKLASENIQMNLSIAFHLFFHTSPFSEEKKKRLFWQSDDSAECF